MRIISLAFCMFFSLWAFNSANAVQPDEILSDPALEARARVISKDLRCLVCQNQSIDDSDADLAKDLRVIVRERLSAGDSNDEVLDFVVVRYGNYVLLNPPVNNQTMVLWAGPIFILLFGFIAVFFWFRRKSEPDTANIKTDNKVKTESSASKLSDDEEKRLKILLGQTASKDED